MHWPSAGTKAVRRSAWASFSSYLGILGGCPFLMIMTVKSRVCASGTRTKRQASVHAVIFIISANNHSGLSAFCSSILDFLIAGSPCYLYTALCRSNYVLVLRVFCKFPCKIASWGPHVQASLRDPVPIRSYNRIIQRKESERRVFGLVFYLGHVFLLSSDLWDVRFPRCCFLRDSATDECLLVTEIHTPGRETCNEPRK
jgi:hypothetical protein